MLKKLLIKALMYGFVMFGLSLYAGYLMTGHLPAYATNWSNFFSGMRTSPSAVPSNWRDIGKLEHKAGAGDGNFEVMQGGKTVIYKWKDANGHWQYGEHAPATSSATKIEIAISVPAEIQSPAVNKSQQATKQGHPELANPYSPEGVKHMMDKAHDVQRLMNQRNDQLKEE